MRIDVYYFRPALFRLDDIRESDGVSLGHIAAHDQDTVAIDQVLRKGGGPAAPKRSTQTGYG